MSNIVRKRRYIENFRVGENESWLTDMAVEGLHLSKLGIWFAHFERGEARQMRYRIDFTPPDTFLSDGQKQLYAEAGWEFVCDSRDMQVFRSPEELGAPELHTDPVEQAISLQQLKRKTVRDSIIMIPLSIAGLVMMYFSIFLGRTPLLSLVQGTSVNLPFMVLLQVYICYNAIRSALAISRLSRDLREGRPVNHRANWQRHQFQGRVAMLILVLMTPLVIGWPLLQISSRHSETLPLTNDNQMLLRLADIEQNPLLERESSVMADDVDWANRVVYEWSPYARTILKVNENGIITGEMWDDNSGEYSPSLNYDLYKLRFPFMAQGVLEDLCVWYGFHGEQPVVEKSGRPGFERLFVREEGISKEVFASTGSAVIYLRYYGEQPLEQVLDVAGEWLARI